MPLNLGRKSNPWNDYSSSSAFGLHLPAFHYPCRRSDLILVFRSHGLFVRYPLRTIRYIVFGLAGKAVHPAPVYPFSGLGVSYVECSHHGAERNRRET